MFKKVILSKVNIIYNKYNNKKNKFNFFYKEYLLIF